MRRQGKATAHAAWTFVTSLLMSLSRMNRARSFTVPSCLYSVSSHHVPLPNPCSNRGLLFAADESTGLRLSSSLPALDEIQAPRVEAEAVVHSLPRAWYGRGEAAAPGSRVHGCSPVPTCSWHRGGPLWCPARPRAAPTVDGLEATRRIKEQWPETKILVLSSRTEVLGRFFPQPPVLD